MFISRFDPDRFLGPIGLSGLAINREGEGGGAGGGGGSGSGSGGGEGDGDLPASTREMITRTVNAAVSTQLSRKLPNVVGDAVNKAMGPVLEKLGAGAGGGDDDEGAGGGDDDGAGKGKGKGKGKGGDDDNPRLNRLERQLEQERRAREKAEKEREEERTRAKQNRRDQTLAEQLEKLGVNEHRRRGALAILRDQVDYDEDGNLIAKVKRDGLEEEIPVDEFVKSWAGTDEGKAYLPPDDSRGAGFKGTTARRAGARRPASPEEAAAERKRAASETLHSEVLKGLTSGGVDLE